MSKDRGKGSSNDNKTMSHPQSIEEVLNQISKSRNQSQMTVFLVYPLPCFGQGLGIFGTMVLRVWVISILLCFVVE